MIWLKKYEILRKEKTESVMRKKENIEFRGNILESFLLILQLRIFLISR